MNQTDLNPIGTAFTLLMVVLLFLLPRKYTIIPVICVSLLLTLNLRLVIAGFDFTMERLIFTAAWIRVLTRGDGNNFKFNKIDKLLIYMLVVWTLTYLIKWGTFGSFVNRLGLVFNISSMYFLSRILIRTIEDVQITIMSLIILSFPISLLMINEQVTDRNLFSFLGGVSKYSSIRLGEIRSQGSFDHAILAGNFGAALTPLVFGLWWNKTIKINILFLGLLSSFIIVATSHSSGPFLAYLSGIAAISLWPFHNSMRLIRWITMFFLVALHFAMKAPVWALIMRIGTSGSSYHRFELIDETIKNFGDWWLIGATSTADWGHLRTMTDLANYYVRIAVDSGLLGLLLFLAVITYSFKSAGKVIQQNKSQFGLQKFTWAISSSLFVHTVAFIGISYKGSNLFLLFITISILSSMGTWIFNAEENFIPQQKSYY